MAQIHSLQSILVFIFFFSFALCHAQVDDAEYVVYDETEGPGIYRASETRYFDLLHTELAVSFDWEKQYVLGKANLTLTPLFFEQDELVFDAKGMGINKVALVMQGEMKALEYKYDDLELTISFNDLIQPNDTLEVFIDYVAKPMELETTGGTAIEDNRGLYFINPLGEDPGKPQQIWTQGETEASSAWFPTIDAPNERCTQEISITIEDRFNTLSNGVLTKSTKNPDGTRTDTWSMDKPHAPYLFMLAIGEYAVIEDEWNGLSVRYHVEKEYEPHAQAIFGNTPEMMTYFSELLGYSYPWPNYDQVVVRDFVSGAMENTSSSTFMESVQITQRELIDYNWDDIIAHELFHQWFGDLVTCESWSNLTLNEGFASYSEYLWREHKYGQDEADYHLMTDNETYFDEAAYDPKNLIRYYYEDKDDMFDRHSYNKGGAVLHMLRNYLGDRAFFAGLKKYLHDNAYQSVELANLRMAFEAVCGEDLNWFFDQWYFAPGHPYIFVEHAWDSDTLTVIVEQAQEGQIYKLPVFIDVWQGGERKSYPVEVAEASEIYQFPMTEKPDLVVFDGERHLLAEISHEHTEEELIFQLKNDPSLYGRLQTMDSLYSFKSKKLIDAALQTAFEDPHYLIRQYAVEHLIEKRVKLKKYESQVVKLLKDESSHVRTMALTYVGRQDFEAYKETIVNALNDTSLMVTGAAINQFVENDEEVPANALTELSGENNLNILVPLGMYYAKQEGEESFQWYEQKIEEVKAQDLYYFIQVYAEKLLSAPMPYRESAARKFEELAKNGSHYTARLAAFQALHLLSDIDGVDESIEYIRKNETDERLLEYYEQF